MKQRARNICFLRRVKSFRSELQRRRLNAATMDEEAKEQTRPRRRNVICKSRDRVAAV